VPSARATEPNTSKVVDELYRVLPDPGTDCVPQARSGGQPTREIGKTYRKCPNPASKGSFYKMAETIPFSGTLEDVSGLGTVCVVFKFRSGCSFRLYCRPGLPGLI